MHTQPDIHMRGGARTYAAIIKQTGTNAPTATVLVNTLGKEVVWTRDNEGGYTATATGALSATKTIATGFGDGSSGALIPLSYTTKGYYQVSPQASTDTFSLFTFADLDYTAKELSDIGGSIYVEVIVYP